MAANIFPASFVATVTLLIRGVAGILVGSTVAFLVDSFGVGAAEGAEEGSGGVGIRDTGGGVTTIDDAGVVGMSRPICVGGCAGGKSSPTGITGGAN